MVAPPPPPRVIDASAGDIEIEIEDTKATMVRAEPPPLPPPAPLRASGTGVPSPELLAARAEQSAVAAKAVVTRVGASFAGQPVQLSGDEARLHHARKILEACEVELRSGSLEKARAGRLHYECARLCETPLGDLKAAGEHYLKAHAFTPEHLPTIQGARRVLLEQKAHAAALPLFDAEIRLCAEASEKAYLLYEKGRVLEDSLAQRREARDAYEAAVGLAELDPTLLSALSRAEEQASAWDSLDRSLERTANAVARDPHHRAAVLVERARLKEARKNDSTSATELFQAAIEMDARAPGAMHALKRLHYSHQRWRDLIAVLEREASLASDASARSLAFYRIARIASDRLGDLGGAVGALERAHAETPGDVTVLEELARVYERTEQYPALALALERLVALCNSPTERVGYLHRIGEIFEQRLDNEERAIEFYERALTEEGSYQPALAALGALYGRQKRWEPLIGMHLKEADGAGDNDRRAAAHARVAEIYEVQLSNPERAEQHHARALGLVPGYAPSFKALVRLFSQAGKHRELAELYERVVDTATDNETRIAYLFKIGRLHEDALGAPGSAVAAYKRILEIDPANLGAIHALERAAERSGRYKDLIAALELEAEKISDKRKTVPLLHRAGEVEEDYLTDPEAALRYYKRVVQLNPSYVPALTSMGRIYYRTGRWEELLDTYRRELKATPKSASSAALLYKIGEISERQVGRYEDAIAAYREAIEVDPFHQPALHALARMLGERAQWKDLVKLLELELSALKDEKQRARVAFRVGEVYENRLGAPDKALGAYEQALASVSDFRPALDGRLRLLTQARDAKKAVEEFEREAKLAADPALAVAALISAGQIWRDDLKDSKRAVESFEAVLERDPKNLGALLALESIYAELGAWESLARVFATSAGVMADEGARVAAFRELARLIERKNLGSVEQLKQTYYEILKLRPGDADALGALERLAITGKDSGLLAQVDARLGAATEEPTLVAAHYTRLAEALEAAEDPSSLPLFRAALLRDPDNFAATRGLSRLALRAGDPDLLEEAAEAEARVTRDLAAAAGLFVRASEARAGAGDPTAAARTLWRSLELNPGDATTSERLGELMLAQGRLDELIDALSAAARGASDRQRSAALWVRVAELLADHKHDLPAGIAALARVEKQVVGHVPALLKLAELYARDAQWTQAVERLTQVLRLSPPRDAAIDANLQLASIMGKRLDDRDRARSHLKAVLDLDEHNREALKQLLSLQIKASEHDAAAETAAKLVRVSPEKGAQAEALSLLGQLEQRRRQLDAAVQAYEQAVTLVGMQGGVAADFKKLLVEMKHAGGQPPWSRYVAALGRHIEQGSLDTELTVMVCLEIARVQGDELRQNDQAAATLRRGLERNPRDLELRTELAGRLRKSGQLAEAVQELRKLLAVDVNREQTWRDLAETFTAMQRLNEATLAVAPLAALGRANDYELSTLRARPPRPAAIPARSFESTGLAAIDALSADDPATQLASALSEGLEKVYPPDFDRYGVSSRDRVSARSGHPLRQLADRVAAIFGVQEYDLYPHQGQVPSVTVEFCDPVGVFVPSAFANLTESQQVFALARVMANVARGIAVVDKLAPDGLELFLVAAARNVDSNFGARIGDDEYMASLSKRLYKTLSWGRRRAFEDAAQRYVSTSRNVAEWATRARMTAARAAALTADDLVGGVTLIRQTEGDKSSLAAPSQAMGMALVQDLMRFWVSDEAFAVRRALGL